MSRLRVAVITSGAAENVSTWSGIPHFVLDALRRRGDIEVVPLVVPGLRALRRLNGRSIPGYGVIDPRTSVVVSRSFAAIVARQVRAAKADVVLALSCPEVVSSWSSPIPVVYFSDLTWSSRQLNFATYFGPHNPRQRESGASLERSLFARAAKIGFASEAALAEYVEITGSADQAFLCPMGANLYPEDTVHEPTIGRPHNDSFLKLLWVGVEWDRKGGEEAIGACHRLRERGHRVQLTVVGTTPSSRCGDVDVLVTGRLSKDKPGERADLMRFFRTADVFVLPTKREAYGLVFAEAAAFALPSVAVAVDGVPTVVQHGSSGLLSKTWEPESLAVLIERATTDGTREQLRHGARSWFEESVNWSTWSNRMTSELMGVAA